MIGSTLHHYKIVDEVGEGGMGKVYVAEDLKLHRKVALKILLPEVASDPERRKRFVREARAIAALNHPNIVTIHAVEESEETYFIAMELIDGHDLSAMMGDNGMTLADFFRVAVPLVDAISAAHDKGITHRDIKPGNIMVNDNGRVKVLDFGLAKLLNVDPPAEQASKMDDQERFLATHHLTVEGQLLGTLAYMSPEQAEGRTVDVRSDVFSLGVLFYEMLTGRQPFTGDSRIAVLSSIVNDNPPLVTEIKGTLPRHLARIVRRCLEKDPGRRYQSASDVRTELELLMEEVQSGELETAPLGFEATVLDDASPLAADSAVAGRLQTTVPGRSGVSRPTSDSFNVRIPTRWLPRLLTLTAAAVIVGTIGFLTVRGLGDLLEGGDSAPLDPVFTPLTELSGQEQFPSLAPDAEDVIYASDADGNWDIFLLRVGGSRAFNLTEDSPFDDTQPAYSPDGDYIVFRSERDGGGIFVMEATGESVTRVLSYGFNPVWSPDGRTIVFATENVSGPAGRIGVSELWSLSADTWEATRLNEGDAVQPSYSPNGQRIAYWGIPAGTGQRDIWTIPATGGEPVPVTDDEFWDWNPVWAPDGRYLYFISDRGGSMNLWRVGVDEQSGQVRSEPEPVTTPSPYVAHLSVSADGSKIAYVSQVNAKNVQRVDFDPQAGVVSGSPEWVTLGQRSWADPSPSPDGEWVAVRSVLQGEDLFLVKTDGTGRQQLTDDQFHEGPPRFSPDGSELAFRSDRSGTSEVWRLTLGPGITLGLGGPGTATQVTSAMPASLDTPVWSPDGALIAASDRINGGTYIIDPDLPWDEQTPTTVTDYHDHTGRFEVWSWSPDGAKLAGVHRQAGGAAAGIVVYDFGTETFEHITETGASPVWLEDGSRLVYWDRGRLFVLDTDSGASEEVLNIAPDAVGEFALSADGTTIFFTRRTRESEVWLAELQ